MLNTPILGNGKIYANTSAGACCFDPISGAIIWSFAASGSDIALTYYNGNIYYLAANYLYCIDGTTGQKKWEYIHGATSFRHTAPLVTSGLTYIQLERGGLCAVNTNTGALVWSKPPYYLNGSNTGLNIKNGNLYAMGRSLYILDSATGNIKQMANQPLADVSGYSTESLWGDGVSPLLVDSFAIVGGYVPEVYSAIDLTYQYTMPSYKGGKLPGPISSNSGVTAVGSICYYTAPQAEEIRNDLGTDYLCSVYAFNYKTRQLVWRVTLPDANPLFAAPCIVAKSGLVYRGGKGILRN
jgi:outer membrane protein assembly factor BamB